MKNPFVTNGYVSPEYFCDREKETAKIVSLLTNENNIALISPRRLGKTDLLRHCFGQPEIKEHYHTFIIDIYATSSVRDFVNVFGKAVLDELRPKGKSVWGTFLNVLASLRSEITFDMNGRAGEVNIAPIRCLWDPEKTKWALEQRCICVRSAASMLGSSAYLVICWNSSMAIRQGFPALFR